MALLCGLAGCRGGGGTMLLGNGSEKGWMDGGAASRMGGVDSIAIGRHLGRHLTARKVSVCVSAINGQEA